MMNTVIFMNMIDNCRNSEELEILDELFRKEFKLSQDLSNLDLALYEDDEIGSIQNVFAMKFLELADKRMAGKKTISFKKTSLDIEVYINGKFLFVIDRMCLNKTSFEDYYYYLKDCFKMFKDEIRLA